MLFPKGVDVRVLNRIVLFLRDNGLWVERHSYSFRVMYMGRFVASFHIYPGFNSVVLKLYSGDRWVDGFLERIVKEAFSIFLPSYVVEVRHMDA